MCATHLEAVQSTCESFIINLFSYNAIIWRNSIVFFSFLTRIPVGTHKFRTLSCTLLLK